MPATTRSHNKQPRLEDLSTTGSVKRSKRKSSPNIEEVSTTTSSRTKRAKNTSSNKTTPQNQPKQSYSARDKAQNSRKVFINRSPVLELWAACVTKFLHPDLAWPTCMSAGKVVATICAVAKGRAIGTIEESQSKDKSHKKKQTPEESKIEVMQFKLPIVNNAALFAGKPKPGNETQLMKKFGDAYEPVKAVFEQGLQSWEGDANALNANAFGFYEQFRPNVARGQAGWGFKGELDLDKVEKAITKTQALLPSSVKKE